MGSGSQGCQTRCCNRRLKFRNTRARRSINGYTFYSSHNYPGNRCENQSSHELPAEMLSRVWATMQMSVC